MTTDLDATARRLLEERTSVLHRNLPKALAGMEEPIHQIRVASRRLRVSLPLLAPKPEGRRVRRIVASLRDLARVAGTSRDVDVALALFDEQRPHQAVPPDEGRILRARLVAARGRRRRKMAQDLLDLEIARLRRDLRVTVARPAPDLFTVLSRLRRARDLRGAALLGALDSLGATYDPVALHAIRRQARRLRYTAEVAAAFRDEAGEAPRTFKLLQDHLGSLHDAHVLSLWLGGQARRASRSGAAGLAEAAAAMSASFEQLARSLHRAYLLEKPAELVLRSLAMMGRGESAA